MKRMVQVLFLIPGVLLGCCTGCQRSDPAKAPKPEIPQATEMPPLKSGTHQKVTSVPGGERLRYTISIPQGLSEEDKAPLIVLLHYGGEVTPFYGAGMIDALGKPAFGELKAVMVAPDALNNQDWTSPANERAVVWLTRSIIKSYPIDSKKVLVTGYSLGGQGTWFMAGRHQDLFTAAMPVAGAPAGADLEWKIPVYAIHSRDDEIIPLGPTQKHVEQLKGKGANVQIKVISGLSHYKTPQFAKPMKEALPWLRDVWK